MNDGQVSVDGRSFPLEALFPVMATQNSEEHYGTYPLPESQMDRFLLRLRIDYSPLPRMQRRHPARVAGAPRGRGSGAAPGRLGAWPRCGGCRMRPSGCTSLPEPRRLCRGGGGGDQRRFCRTSRSVSRRAARSPGGTPDGQRRSARGATTCSPTISSRWRRWCWRTG